MTYDSWKSTNPADAELGTTHDRQDEPRIVTSYWAKPGPQRGFDWSASYAGDEPSDAGHMAIGYGHTEAEAIADLLKSYPMEDSTLLSPTQLAAREGCVTASFLPSLLAGDEPAMMREWRRLVGDPDYEPENLDNEWPVQLGTYLEPFALDWHERKTGRELSLRGDVVKSRERPWFACTLDAFRSDDATVIDCKAPGPWRKIDEVISYYTPQLIGQRACLNAERAALLIVHGGQEPVEHAVEWEADYEQLVWGRVDQFWRCVETLTEPVAQTPAPAPIKPEKTYCMESDNLWCSEAITWLENRPAALKAKAAELELKGLVPLDAVRCYGRGVEIRRNKAGSLSLREMRA